MKNWLKRLGWFAKKDRSQVDDEQSLFFDETLPGEPELRRSVAAHQPPVNRVKNVERPARHK